MKRLLIVLALVLAGVSSSACPKAPPNLTPAGQLAYYQTQVINTLNLVRDAAVAANAQVPPLLSTPTTTAIVKWHQTAVTIVQAAGAGWQTLVKTSFDTLVPTLPAADQQRIAPYVPLVDAILSQVL